MSKKRHSSTTQRSALHHHATEQQPYNNPHNTSAISNSNHHPVHQNLVGQGGVMGFTGGGSRNNFNYWNSVEINQYIMN